IKSDELRDRLSALNEKLKEAGKVTQKQLKKLREEHLPRLEKYEKQLATLGERNSYSKTDVDATFMRLKDDHMQNGQLKPAYNLQISTQQQFILNYSLHQTSTDYQTLPSHLDGYEALYDEKPKAIVADAGYGSDENYGVLEQKGIEAYIKYNTFDREQKEGVKAFSNDSLHYNQAE